MLTQTNSRRNIKRAAKINYLLRINGYTQRTMAEELGISYVWVCNVINGKGYNPKVENWLKENLGI
ncbi:helix-turn-helix transcriptional regulator [bacterium]|nr:helix-turn-helix transcriptional regulator [bacterium]